MISPRPRNITDIRSWFGLVNQVACAFSMAERMQPFREPLKSGARFESSSELDAIYSMSPRTQPSKKSSGASAPSTSPNRPASLYGLVDRRHRLLATPTALQVQANPSLLLH